MGTRTGSRDWETILRCLEEIKGVVTERLVPSSAREHFRQAEKEVLLGVRSCLDAAISRLDEAEASDSTRSGVKEIPIEE
jgi:hypothetical protein